MPGDSRKVKALLVLMFAFTAANFAATLYSRGGQQPDKDKTPYAERVKEIKNKFPIADYEAPEPTDPRKRAKRKARNARHDESVIGVRGGLNVPPDSGGEISLITHWEIWLPRIPAPQSDVVLIGDVLDARAYVSNDKSGVYSEFNVRVVDVLKNSTPSSVTPGGQVLVERQGGQVRYPSGRVWWFHVDLQYMPVVSRRYVLFLKRLDEDSFFIVTGYELREGRIYALDASTIFTFYDGTDEASFLNLSAGGDS